MNWNEKFNLGLLYEDFLDRYATESQKDRWQKIRHEVALTRDQQNLLTSFERQMNVLCLAGAWCGDCINQCPIFAEFAKATATIQLRFLDRDDHADVQKELQINGGNRVPTVVFISEDGYEVSRFGERTLSKYRQLMREQGGASCPTGTVTPGDSLLGQVTQDWLNEFERVQWLLRFSPRLRQKHGD